MKLSTVNTIFWVATAAFWSLLIGDLLTPDRAPVILSAIQQVSVYVLLSAQFYALGAKRSTKKNPTYEMSA